MQVFFSALIDVAGHAKMLDEAFGILQDAKSQGIRLGTITYSSLMGACCNVCCLLIAVARVLNTTDTLFSFNLGEKLEESTGALWKDQVNQT